LRGAWPSAAARDGHSRLGRTAHLQYFAARDGAPHLSRLRQMSLDGQMPAGQQEAGQEDQI